MGRERIGLSSRAREAAALLGLEIRAARTERKWSQAFLASHIGVTPRTVSHIERGDPAVSIGNVLNAAVAVGVPLFQTDDTDELRRTRSLTAQLVALLPRAVRKEDLSHVDRDF
ncbi:MAG: helix-turn-helix transcriptional regulator [Leucobacter sp.]